MNHDSLLTRLDTLVKHGVQATTYDIYGSYAHIYRSTHLAQLTYFHFDTEHLPGT